MYLNIGKKPQKTDRKRSVRNKAKIQAKNRRRRRSLQLPKASSHGAR